MRGSADINSIKRVGSVNQHKEVLAISNFRRLLAARTISNFGNGMAPTALAFSILAMPNGDATTLSLVLTASAIPLVLMLPIGGVISDRRGRAFMISTMDIVLSLVVFAQAYLFTLAQPPIAALVVLAASAGDRKSTRLNSSH